MKQTKTMRMIITALFSALICVATMLVQIPIPATGGYANLGDGVILICAFLMHPAQAVIAAGLGSMLADVLTGYVIFAPGTLIIKAGVALIGALVYHGFVCKWRPMPKLLAMVIAALLAEAFMVLGYFFYEGVILGVGMAAAGGIMGNVGQGVVGAIVGCVVSPILSRTRGMHELLQNTWHK